MRHDYSPERKSPVIAFVALTMFLASVCGFLALVGAVMSR